MARDGSQTRERIDRTALELFAEKGVDQTTIGDIARGAGISEGAIYRHYASKDELIWGLFLRQLHRFGAERSIWSGSRPRVAGPARPS